MTMQVQAVEALEQMRIALNRFGGDLDEALAAAERGLRVAEEWIAERVRAWQYEVRQATEEVEDARQALASCEADTDEDGHGRSCVGEEAALASAQRQLAHAKEQLAIAQRWLQAIDSAGAEYQREALRMRQTAEECVAKGAANLTALGSRLEAYAEDFVQEVNRFARDMPDAISQGLGKSLETAFPGIPGVGELPDLVQLAAHYERMRLGLGLTHQQMAVHILLSAFNIKM